MIPTVVTRRKLSEVRRRQILQATVTVIGERGLCDTRISDIAERAGASSALVLYYFGSKDRLLAEALAFQVVLGDTEGPPERMYEICVGMAASELGFEGRAGSRPRLPAARRRPQGARPRAQRPPSRAEARSR